MAINLREDGTKKVIFSGIKPSGDITLGNYIGALKPWSEIQNDYECYYCVVDQHAITEAQTPADLRRRSLTGLALYIACGLNPEEVTLFIQSHVPEHVQLMWVLNTVTYMGELNRMTQYKDKSRKNEQNLNAGLFTYPVLMAADILLYSADIVPVGDDQKQHVEIARDIAHRFNNRYSETFVLPDVYNPKVGARIMSLQDASSKMSKSDENTGGSIYLLDKPEDIARKIKRAVTDSIGVVNYSDSQPEIKNLLNIYSALSDIEIDDIVKKYSGVGYGVFKSELSEVVVERLSKIQSKYYDLMKNKDYLEQIYKQGAQKASYRAGKMVSKVHKKVGFIAR